MASLPSGKSATGLSAIGGLHSRYYWPMMKTAYTPRKPTASEIRITRITSWRSRERLTICLRHAYLKVCALLVPRELQVEHSGGVKAMTTEQIERGIELIKEILAQREAGANAKVIEGEATPSLPAPTAVNAKSS